MRTRVSKYLISLSLLLFTAVIHAEANPQVLVENAINQMLKELETNKAKIAEDKTVVRGIVEQVILPNMAINTISRRVMGKHARKASDEQKARFAEAFKGYMIRFYSNAFAEYTDETVDFLEAPEFEKKKRVTVRTKLNRASGAPIPIDYKLQRSGDSWKIVDVKIEGISLVISNRSQFGGNISRDGLDTVIAKLEYKNENESEAEEEQ